MARELPNPHRAFVDPRKVRDYLLSLGHPEGRYKAAFFLRLGYSQADWVRLHVDLLELARTGETESGELTRYGRKYLTEGSLLGPSGKKAEVTAVWIVRCGEDFPRLVTVVPGGAS